MTTNIDGQSNLVTMHCKSDRHVIYESENKFLLYRVIQHSPSPGESLGDCIGSYTDLDSAMSAAEHMT